MIIGLAVQNRGLNAALFNYSLCAGPDLIFVALADVFTYLPASKAWSAIFYLAMFLIAFGNQVRQFLLNIKKR